MSYFPTDIPFMSDEEMRENGIRIPGDVSDTNVGNIECIRRQDAVDAVHEEFDDCTVWDESGKRTADEVESIIDRVPPADVAPVEKLKAEIYKLKHQSEQSFGNRDYYVGYISALSTVEGILAVMDREE